MGIVILLIVAVVTLLLFLRRRGSDGKKEKLWNECRQLLNLSPGEADKIIESYMENLRSKHPARSDEWYLEKIIYDLERDR